MTRKPVSWQGLPGPNMCARSRSALRPEWRRSPWMATPGDRRARVLINETLRRGEDVAPGGPPKVTRKGTQNLSSHQVQLGLLRLGRVVADPASGFVHALGAEHDQVVGVHDALGVHTRGPHTGGRRPASWSPIRRGRTASGSARTAAADSRCRARPRSLVCLPLPTAPRFRRVVRRRTVPRRFRSPEGCPQLDATVLRRSRRGSPSTFRLEWETTSVSAYRTSSRGLKVWTGTRAI